MSEALVVALAAIFVGLVIVAAMGDAWSRRLVRQLPERDQLWRLSCRLSGIPTLVAIALAIAVAMLAATTQFLASRAVDLVIFGIVGAIIGAWCFGGGARRAYWGALHDTLDAALPPEGVARERFNQEHDIIHSESSDDRNSAIRRIVAAWITERSP